jgi:ABC-2 type transport system ATP-binding protein
VNEFYLVLAFPMVAGLGWGLVKGLLFWWDRARAFTIMLRASGWFQFLFLCIPAAAVVHYGMNAGTLGQMGLAWPQAGDAPVWVVTLLTIFCAPPLGLLLYVNEVVLSAQVRRLLKARGGARMAAVVQGQSGSFASLPAPSFLDFMSASALTAAAEELVWRGFLLYFLRTELHFSALAALVVAALAFGVNHAYFGARNVALKALDGIVWGAVLLATSSLLAPYVSHLVFQYCLWRRLNRGAAPPRVEAARGEAPPAAVAASTVVAPRAPGDVIIEVIGLHKAYGPTVAVEEISFEVRRGEIFGMIGPNGAGKTTTIECIEGQRQADRGLVRVLGLNPAAPDSPLRARIGVQLQVASLPPRIKVWEALDLFASFYQKPQSWRRVLKEVGLAEKAKSEFRKLSGGQRQRLFIALALLNDPEVLFLDELTTGLDPQGRRKMWDLVREVRDRGKTVFLTTHYMEEAERLCDRVAIVDRGRIIALDTPASLVRGADVRVSFELQPDADPAPLAALEAVTRVEREKERVVVYGRDGMLGAVVRALEGRGWRFQDLRTESSRLEDVFLSLTGRELRE